ncbi:MAG: type IV pilin protein [bacterium]|jgi:prepilin-type N-terminal cleavage/methylation domain-containing protein
MKKKSGFTLIELLIVVAIIGILAAIAVPNFLNAQIRAKIARSKSDLKALAMAQEQYYLDNNVYTYPYKLHPLTTPVSYIGSIPDDVFAPKQLEEAKANSEAGAEFTWYRYVYGTNGKWGGLDVPNLRTAHCADYYAYFAPFTPVRSTAESLAARGCPTTYLIKSFGPNTGSQGIANQYGDDYTLRYDSSNGLISKGDIAVFGPGMMVE